MAKDLNKIASECLAYNTHFDKVFVASDGTPFQHKNDAVNHANKLTEKEVLVFERDGNKEEPGAVTKTYAINAKDTIKLIKGATSIDSVMALTEGEERSSVLAEAEKQIAILKQNALDEQADAADEANKKRLNETPTDPQGTEGLGDGKSASE